ncbi:hypothetical protein QBC39DRAFT_344673 [Podospora conica]|nr:hypothetical protein QBC39DRAFT_344673 [Schizothecium conicum]
MESVVEVMLAREVVVLQGGERVRWRWLEGVVEQEGGDGVGELAGTSWGYRMVKARRDFRSRIEGDGVPFGELWEEFSGWEGREARDKVLALLAVSGEDIGRHLVPDGGDISGDEEPQMDLDNDMPDTYLALDGLLRLDESMLAALAQWFDMVMEHITLELNSLVEECNATVEYDIFGRAVGNVDGEIARFQGLLQRMDDLELELDRIAHIRDIVRGFRLRMEEELDLLDARVDFGAAGG